MVVYYVYKNERAFPVCAGKARIISSISFQNFYESNFPAYPKRCLQHQHMPGIENITIQAPKFFIVLAIESRSF
jgi:hypothetical protein